MEPLRGRDGIRIVRFPVREPLDLAGYVRLAVEGEPLSMADRDCGVLLLDGTWELARKMNAAFAAVPPRSLTGYRTAYPRVSKLYQDPGDGLASVEALYLAYRLLGRPTVGLLDDYRWAEQFLARNRLADHE